MTKTFNILQKVQKSWEMEKIVRGGEGSAR